MKKNGMGSHQSSDAGKTEWLTPPVILEKLGSFDLDPCSPINRPWDTATHHYTILDDGLNKEWFGKVYCNPPYGTQTAVWLNKLSKHGNGIALIFARTETEMFFEEVWNKADALLFIKGRLFFHHVTGERGSSNSGAPSVLIAYGSDCVKQLENSNIEGKLIYLRY